MKRILSSSFSKLFSTFKSSNLIPASIKANDFLEPRHIGPRKVDSQEMLKSLNLQSIDDLISKVIPSHVRDSNPLDKDGFKIPEGIPESQFLSEFTTLMDKNKKYKCYIGNGFSKSITPAVIKRNVLENPNWYTPYTPYQAEIGQGRLESLINFQTLVSELTGMQISNASLLDEGTACAESMVMCHNIHEDANKTKFFISSNTFPHVKEVVKTKAKFLGIDVVEGNHNEYDFTHAKDIFGVLIQNPDNTGNVTDLTSLITSLKNQGIVVSVCADILANAIFKSPGEMGADIVCGTTQRLGIPIGYGGPHAGYIATKDEHKRKLPGRLIGVSKDTHGNLAYRMSLQTREQHIKREKATSNICTAQALLANMSAFYGIFHGPKGLSDIATRIYQLTNILSSELSKVGATVVSKSVFDTVAVTIKRNSSEIVQHFLNKEINIRKIDSDTVSFTLDETTTIDDVIELTTIFSSFLKTTYSPNISDFTHLPTVPSSLVRKSAFLQQPIFNTLNSETQLMRYIRRLESKDYGLTKGMIPLGSCTMKLNPASTMLPMSWSSLDIHPFVPLNQVQGYQEMLAELNRYLISITKFDGFTFQPNSGSQGEYTGLLTIRAFHNSKGNSHRDLVLIPTSAHGTNPASAVMAGMRVVTVATDAEGNINVEDLKAKAEKHKHELGAFMITYPSTHGIYEESVRQCIEIIHANGGQVYMDGANMNAQVGFTSPGFLEADVCHLNMHKTFAIPHGGGGPGMGPIGVKKHLVPFLPGSPEITTSGSTSLGSVSSAPWGSASILAISYSFLKQLGFSGLTNSTSQAILNANYLANVLKSHFKILYTGKNGFVGHEFILDIRPIKAKCGISEEDIAKRLMDFSFHGPTMSFPVPGTLMIEPTESEDKTELDHFAAALIQIRKEISKVESGEYNKSNNILKNAPHTYSDFLSGGWKHSYSMEEAFFPLPWVKSKGKFWPTVGRIDNAHGDRNLICTCPPLTDYE